MNLEQMANLKAELEERKYNRLSTEEKKKHQEEVRNEGIIQAMLAQKEAKKTQDKEVCLEIDDPGAANKVAEDGAVTFQDSSEFLKLSVQLNSARTKPENKLGEGGFYIKLLDPSTFENTIKIIQMQDANDEGNTLIQTFHMKDKKETTQASITMSQAL
jgi:hypothetical protein